MIETQLTALHVCQVEVLPFLNRCSGQEGESAQDKMSCFCITWEDLAITLSLRGNAGGKDNFYICWGSPCHASQT